MPLGVHFDVLGSGKAPNICVLLQPRPATEGSEWRLVSSWQVPPWGPLPAEEHAHRPGAYQHEPPCPVYDIHVRQLSPR